MAFVVQVLHQRALATLTGPLDEHDRGVLQGVHDQGGEMAAGHG